MLDVSVSHTINQTLILRRNKGKEAPREGVGGGGRGEEMEEKKKTRRRRRRRKKRTKRRKRRRKRRGTETDVH